jgi:hypothetical protein
MQAPSPRTAPARALGQGARALEKARERAIKARERAIKAHERSIKAHERSIKAHERSKRRASDRTRPGGPAQRPPPARDASTSPAGPRPLSAERCVTMVRGMVNKIHIKYCQV